MNTTTYNQVIQNLEYLGLTEMTNHLDETVDFVTDNQLSFIDGLRILTGYQRDKKQSNMMISMVKTAGFPIIRKIEDFEFEYQPNLNREKIMDLMSLRFIEKGENIIFIGNSGVGKTHLASAIGYQAAIHRNTTYFIKFRDLIEQLRKAYYEGTLEKKIKTFFKYKILIIDEIGYLPVNKDDSKLFFQLIDKRYEKRSTVLTTNITFSQWDEIFTDPVTANAILDRLLHHCHVINITGKSYRIKDYLNEMEESKE